MPRPRAARPRPARGLRRTLLLLGTAALLLAATALPAMAQPAPPMPIPTPPAAPSIAPGGADAGVPAPGGQSVTISVGGEGDKPSQSLLVIVFLTLLSVAPALLIMLTSFTRIVIVLSLTRNALGLQGVPPNQVLVGLALFLSLFVMSPTLSEINRDAIQPMLAGEMDQTEAYQVAMQPLRTFMLGQTRQAELGMFVNASSAGRPATPDDVGMDALIPAFILSELKTAFIIGFLVFIPFLVIDIVISSSLMSMGMMMLPPVLVSLPFKLLLFVMVDGWGLVVRSLITSFS
jgi:flagellar biosynthesis protein FliP